MTDRSRVDGPHDSAVAHNLNEQLRDVENDPGPTRRWPVQFVYGSREAKFLKDGIAAAKNVLPRASEVVEKAG